MLSFQLDTKRKNLLTKRQVVDGIQKPGSGVLLGYQWL